jgi:hypothetical protein
MTTTHNYGPGHRRWGHDVTVVAVNGVSLKATGWGSGLKSGDFVILPNAKNPSGVSRYRIDLVRYYQDPPDMWSAELTHSPQEVTAV